MDYIEYFLKTNKLLIDGIKKSASQPVSQVVGDWRKGMLSGDEAMRLLYDDLVNMVKAEQSQIDSYKDKVAREYQSHDHDKKDNCLICEEYVALWT